MNTPCAAAADLHRHSRVAEIIRHFLSVSVRERVAALRSARERRAMRGEMFRLDGPALRDLGLSRSELESYWAESQGMAEPTRTRVIQERRKEACPTMGA